MSTGSDQNPVFVWIWWLWNGASIGTMISSLVGLIPPIAGVIALIWYSIQIYESNTFQNWMQRRLKAKLARFQAKARAIEVSLKDLEK